MKKKKPIEISVEQMNQCFYIAVTTIASLACNTTASKRDSCTRNAHIEEKQSYKCVLCWNKEIVKYVELMEENTGVFL